MLLRTRTTLNQPACNPWIAWLLALGVFFGIHPQLPAYSGSTDRNETAFTADVEGGVTWGESFEWEGFSGESELEFDSEGDGLHEDSDFESSEGPNALCVSKFGELFSFSATSNSCAPSGPRGWLFQNNHRYLPHGRLNI